MKTIMKTIEGMPPAGENRFWFAEHQPKNTKLPLLLQLREKLTLIPVGEIERMLAAA